MRISDWSSDVCSSDLNGIAKVVIPRSEDGHFYADAQVGAATVRFLIDTGATAVALSRADAQRAGISPRAGEFRSEEHTSELQSLMRISYAVFCLKKKKEK